MIEDPFRSIEVMFACATRDQSLDARDAWVYGIVCGWGPAMDEVAARHGWSDAAVARLRRLRAKWLRKTKR